MTIRKTLAILVLIVFTVTLAGCATNGYYDPGRSAAAGGLGGAAVGAALGSIIGAATGSAATGAWVGAAAGGLVGAVGGALYASHRNSMAQSSASAAQTYNYSPSQGNVVDINNVSVSPTQARAGSQVNMQMTYTILTPSNTPTNVTLVREVRKDGQLIGQPYQVQVTNQNGTFTDQVAYSLQPNAVPGVYAVTSRVVSNMGTSERTTTFTVI